MIDKLFVYSLHSGNNDSLLTAALLCVFLPSSSDRRP